MRRNLSPSERAVVRPRHQAGLSFEQMAELLDMTPAAVEDLYGAIRGHIQKQGEWKHTEDVRRDQAAARRRRRRSPQSG